MRYTCGAICALRHVKRIYITSQQNEVELYRAPKGAYRIYKIYRTSVSEYIAKGELK